MKNLNVYEFTGDFEKAIKNGDIRQIILFSNLYLPINKFIASLGEGKIIEPSEEFPYRQILIKSRSPFRIGEIQTRLIYLDDIYDKTIDKEKLANAIKDICKKFKGSINALPIMSSLNFERNVILKCLEENVYNTKVVILN